MDICAVSATLAREAASLAEQGNYERALALVRAARPLIVSAARNKQKRVLLEVYDKTLEEISNSIAKEQANEVLCVISKSGLV